MVGNPCVPTFIDEQERQLEAYRRIRHRRQRVNAVIREAGIRFLIGGSPANTPNGSPLFYHSSKTLVGYGLFKVWIYLVQLLAGVVGFP